MVFMKSYNFIQFSTNYPYYYPTVCESYNITRKVQEVYIISPFQGSMITPIFTGFLIRMR